MTIHVVLNHRKSNTTEFFITCSYAFDELVHNSDFFWLLIDVFRQLLEHFALVGMNTKLLTPKTRKHKSIINENRRAIKWTDDDVKVQFISVCIHINIPTFHLERDVLTARKMEKKCIEEKLNNF